MGLSTAVVLLTFGQGLGLLHGGDIATHFQWSLLALLVVVLANGVAMIHAAQSDRIIRELRRQLAASSPPASATEP
jgi:hypothetical protein